jgi:hypothetical protein
MYGCLHELKGIFYEIKKKYNIFSHNLSSRFTIIVQHIKWQIVSLFELFLLNPTEIYNAKPSSEINTGLIICKQYAAEE